MRLPWIAGLCALTMIAPLPSDALPPPPPPVHARYGPLMQCLDGYAIAASASEAMFSTPDGMSLVGDREGMSLSREVIDPHRLQVAVIDVAHLGRVTRFERLYRHPAKRIEYLLPARFGGPEMLARSLQFDGSNRDFAILRRISRVEPQSESCRTFAAPDFHGEDLDALYWSPATVAGPVYRCQNGIGYHVREGETVQLQWRPLVPATIASSRLITGGVRLTVDGPITRRDATTSVPLSRYRRSVGIWAGRSILTLAPPQAALSRAAWRRLPPERRYGDGINIEFPAGNEAAARTFATRLEFVDRADPRCRAE